MTYWNPGDQIAYRSVENHQIWYGEPATVVQDSATVTILSLLPGAVCSMPTGFVGDRILETATRSRWEAARAGDWQLQDWIWRDNRVLSFMYPQEFFAIRLFWRESDDCFLCYYVNYQTAFRRITSGFEALDLALDLVVYPDLHYEWKDEEEYQAGILAGAISPEIQRSVQDARERVLQWIIEKTPPFDGSWLSWKAPISWGIPELPVGWSNL